MVVDFANPIETKLAILFHQYTEELADPICRPDFCP
jgi:hypothetical protein